MPALAETVNRSVKNGSPAAPQMPQDAESDALLLTELPPELQPQMRLYRRLYLARIDLDEARAAAEELLVRRIQLPRRKPPVPLLMSLTTALVVSYARPFVASRRNSLIAETTVPGVLLRTLSRDQRQRHDALIDLRNKQVAHSDAEVLEMHIRLIPDGDVGIFRAPRSPFRRDALRSILRIIAKLEDAIDMKCEELRAELPNGVWL